MMDIAKVVKKLVTTHGTNDPFKLCEALRILVMYEDLGSVRGIYQYKFQKRVIHINNNLDSYGRRQVCAHELGHAVLHRKVNTVFFTYLSTDKVEIEANTFAAELLIGEIDPKEYEGFCIDQLAAAFCVQEKLINYKARLQHK